MTTVIHRSWLVNMGGNPPPDLAYVVSDYQDHRRVVTWAEVIEARRVAQRKVLDRKRGPFLPVRAYKVWVAYFDQDIFGGWQAFIETYQRVGWHERSQWICRDRQWLKPALMAAFPLLLPLWQDGEQWYRWKAEFAKRYARRRQDGQPLGVAYVWWDGRDYLRPIAGLKGKR